MNYSALTNDSLTMMYEAVRGALAADDAAEEQREEPRFKVRHTGAWMTHVADLETEMVKRGMMFELIAWDRAIDGLHPTEIWHSNRSGEQVQTGLGEAHERPARFRRPANLSPKRRPETADRILNALLTIERHAAGDGPTIEAHHA